VFRYLQAAFWAAPEVAGLGRLPANVLLLAGFAILGFGHPGFWLLGLALEGAYLYALTNSARFRTLVDAQRLHLSESSVEQERQTLVAKLSPEARGRLENLSAKCARVGQLERDAQVEEFLVEANRDALRKLEWLFLKVLIAQQNLRLLDAEGTSRELHRKAEVLRSEVQADRLSRSLRESKAATLRILEQRLANLDRREQSLAEIDSDLTRIEAQIDLAVDNAGMRGKSEAISANIDLVSQMLDDSVYGDSGQSIAALDRTFGSQAQ